MKDDRIGPNLHLSGRDVHNAFRRVRPYRARRWSKVSRAAKHLYCEIARELNRDLNVKQAWFEGEDDTVTIASVRCSTCGQMLQCEHAEGHACWQIDVVLSEYCRSLQDQSEEMLKSLVEDYGLTSSKQSKLAYIDALVKDYRKQLEGKR